MYSKAMNSIQCPCPLRPIVLWAVNVLLLLCFWPGFAPLYAESAVRDTKIPIRGRLWKQSELQKIYNRIWQNYAIDQSSRQIMSAGEREAVRVEGTILDRASDRRLILLLPDKKVAVQCSTIIPGNKETTVSFMVRRGGTPFYSYEPATDSREQIEQYVDVTMTFKDFVKGLMRGHHFPDAPELSTQAERKGLFRTDRVQTNKVVDP